MIKALNQEIEMKNEEIETMITELLEREKYTCTSHGCPTDVCAVE